jgi:hypothetical protein
MRNETSIEAGLSEERTETYRGGFWLIVRNHMSRKKKKRKERRISITSAENKKWGPRTHPAS